MDKGIMVAHSFRSEQECCAELALHTRWGEAVPLTSLSAKVACEAFVKLKELPCEVIRLATPDANLPFQVHCDASDYGVGCCLIQQDTEGIYRPIALLVKNSMLRKRTEQASRKRPGQCYTG
ncbi:hypothetical protein TNCV_265131 [Trichonephila clavipes]|nr:hypothetical protein TNCV_265131 [Trichonephila clavipes]